MDAGLAKVINSTVGTDDFKSLDKLLYGRQGLVPSSENVYFKIGNLGDKNATVTVTSNSAFKAYSPEPLLSMKMWTDGGFSLEAKVEYGIATSGSWSMSIYGGIAVFVNGTLVATGTDNRSGSIGGSLTKSVRCDNIYFTTGDIVEIKLYIEGYKTSSFSNNVDLFCKTIPTNPIVVYATSVEKPFDITYA